ncbi:MAG: CopG family transcriptional regulator [Terrimicrobiaceae bacterium]
MKTVTVKLSDPVFAEIAHAAKERNISKSQVIRERLQVNGVEQPSLWSRIEDLVVNDPSLARDLSSNPKYLSGYGKSRSHR